MVGAGMQGFSSGVTYYQLNSSTTSIPSRTASTGPYVDGFYGVSGTLEFLIWRLTTSGMTGTSAWTSDLSNLVSQFKLVVNGDILYDWVSGIAPDQDSTEAGRFGYFLNQIGGRALQVPAAGSAAAQEMWLAIPVGAVLSGSTPRFEITTSFYQADLVAGTATTGTNAGTSTFWARFNPNTQRSTRVVSATSFQHGANLTEQVVARIPSIPGGFTLEMISIQNASDNDDNYGDDGIRVLALSQFSMPISMQRWASNELGNGVVTYNAADAAAQTYKASVPGILNVPLYGLAAGDLTMMVANGADADTRLYHPVLTAPLRGVGEPTPRQTVAAIGNTQKSIVARTEGSN